MALVFFLDTFFCHQFFDQRRREGKGKGDVCKGQGDGCKGQGDGCKDACRAVL